MTDVEAFERLIEPMRTLAAEPNPLQAPLVRLWQNEFDGLGAKALRHIWIVGGLSLVVDALPESRMSPAALVPVLERILEMEKRKGTTDE